MHVADDFSVILPYDFDLKVVERSLVRLESGEEPEPFSALLALWEQADLRVDNDYGWRSAQNYEHRLHIRPPLPDTGVQLWMPSGFALSFGRDSIWFYHPLRWSIFAADPTWHQPMRSATEWVREAFHCNDALITWDCSRLVGGFKMGESVERTIAGSKRTIGSCAIAITSFDGRQLTHDPAIAPVELCWRC